MELSLAKATLELDQLSAELEASRARTNALQTELDDLHSRLEASRRREAEFDREISELREHTYFAKLRIKHDGELVEVDSRPSDAIALAVTAKVPIYVAEDVLGEVCGE